MIMKYLIVTMCLLTSGLASATSLEVARLAQLLEHASYDLANDSRGRSWSGSVKHNAKLLSQKAQKLQDSIERGRSSAYVRTRFTDVNRYYQRLEASVVRSMDGSGSHRLRNEFIQLSDLYEALRFEFYGDTDYQSIRSSPPSYPYTYQQPWLGGRNSRNLGIGVLVVPSIRDYDRRRGGQHRAPVTERGNRQFKGSDHRSPVLDRQRRNNRARDLSTGRRSGRKTDTGRETRLEANQGYYRLRQ